MKPKTIFQDRHFQEEFLKFHLDTIEMEDFQDAFAKNCCHLCGMRLSYINETEFCFHWFLLPEGIKKKHFSDYLTQPISFCELENYLRLVANSDGMFKNINDIKEQSSKLIETTIRYKNIEWSFSIGNGDFEGHKKANEGTLPHYHIQIYRDNQPFIVYNDFHIPLTNDDLETLNTFIKDGIKNYYNIYGEGASIIEKDYFMESMGNETVECETKDAMFQTRISLDFSGSNGIKINELESVLTGENIKPRELEKRVLKKIPKSKVTITRNIGEAFVKKKNRNKR